MRRSIFQFDLAFGRSECSVDPGQITLKRRLSTMTAEFSRTVFAAALAVLVTPAAWAGSLALSDAGVSRTPWQLVADQTQILVDLNSASEDDLRTLPGVGPARAHAIVAGRPYKGKDDLVNKNIVPKNVYDGLKDRIVARQK